MQFPTDLKYTREHEWVRIEGEQAYIGITDFAQGELGDILSVDIPLDIGYRMKQGGVFCIVDGAKSMSDLYMPLTGIVTEINTALEQQPELVNQHPYGAGWIIKIRIENPREIPQLLDSSDYQSSL